MSKSHLMPFTLAVFFALSCSSAQAAISLDRTRVIFGGAQKSVSLGIRNDNKELPYLAQAWIENPQQQKVSGPIVVLPPLQRVEPGSGGQVKLVKSPEAEQLPQDRESLFYFNLREVPPRSDEPNTMQIALHTKIKLFYRPESITPDAGDVWQERLIVTPAGNGFRIENPTPYHVTISDLQNAADKRDSTTFNPVMLAPFSVEAVLPDDQVGKDLVLTYISDYGGYQKLNYACGAATCQLKPKP